MIKLDLKDKKILSIITENAKMSSSKISKQVGLSREVVDYRIKRLEKLGVISSYIAKIDMTKFYQMGYQVFIRLSKYSNERLKEVVDFLVKNEYTMWVATVSGDYDVAASFLTAEVSDLHKVITEIEQFIGTNLKEIMLLTYVNEYKNTYEDLFVPKFDEKFVIQKFAQKINLDELDIKILLILSKNAKATNKEISKSAGLTDEAVRKRIIKMESTGIIRGYRGLIDVYKLDLEIYYVLFKFDNLTGKKAKEVETFFRTFPEMYYCARFIGRFNVIGCMVAKDREHYNKLLSKIRNRFHDILVDYDTLIIFKEHKHTYLPEGFKNA